MSCRSLSKSRVSIGTTLPPASTHASGAEKSTPSTGISAGGPTRDACGARPHESCRRPRRAKELVRELGSEVGGASAPMSKCSCCSCACSRFLSSLCCSCAASRAESRVGSRRSSQMVAE
eukprot:scaffold57076_cov66-Phaeocystis_antarctica.AAC.1